MNLSAFGTLLSDVLTITAKNPVISVIYLIFTFVFAAGYIILIGIQFIGISYIVIYVGAIAVLFLFVIMMINIKLVDILEVGREYTKNLPLALSIGFVFLYEIISITMPTVSTAIPAGMYGATASASISGSVNPISLQFLSYPLDILTHLNKFFMFFMSPSQYFYDSISENFVTVINSVLNPVALDINFVNFLHIEMLGQGLYTYGAIWLIICSVILLLAMVAPIFISKISKSKTDILK